MPSIIVPNVRADFDQSALGLQRQKVVQDWSQWSLESGDTGNPRRGAPPRSDLKPFYLPTSIEGNPEDLVFSHGLALNL